MEVRILKSVASPSYSYSTGETVRLEKATANNFIAHGVAEIIEKATKKPPKKAAAKAAKEVAKK